MLKTINKFKKDFLNGPLTINYKKSILFELLQQNEKDDFFNQYKTKFSRILQLFFKELPSILSKDSPNVTISIDKQQVLLPCQSEILLIKSAEAGLFPKAEFLTKTISEIHYTQNTLDFYEKRPYSIRVPRINDLLPLTELENKCWPEPLRASPYDLLRRIDQLPDSHFVLETGEGIAGVIYSMRLTNEDIIDKTTAEDVINFYDPKGPIAFLLAINILPEMRHTGFGDQLLEFMLQYCTLKEGIEKIFAVTLCKNYPDYSHISMEEYIGKRNHTGLLIDPILRFHELHGATIKKIIPKYRPKDKDNKGNGILVEYDILHRKPYYQKNISTDKAINDENINQLIKNCICSVMGKERLALFSWERSFKEIGLESIELMEILNLLNQTFGVRLDSTFFFEYNRPAEVMGYFQGQDKPDQNKKKFEFSETIPSNTIESNRYHWENNYSGKSPIAVIGMACRFPHGADDPDKYWQFLSKGVDCITPVPKERWDMADYYDIQNKPGKIVTQDGGFLHHADKFDSLFFNISPKEAQRLDPQQRILMEVHWEALENAGINALNLKGSQTGIFVGIFGDDYRMLQAKTNQVEDFDALFATGTSFATAAGRLAYFFDFRGPALSIDTACSSSLVAIHQACQSLRTGECDLALASGINLIFSPDLSIAFSSAGMLSPTGRCKTFDASADGYIRGEGCGVVVLKPLEQAIKDRDNIHGVILGTAINQDGASNGLTAPNLSAQKAVIQKALSESCISPEKISYIETHGTGTPLGDPIEIKALKKTYGKNRPKDKPLIIGSVKTNIGHTEACAGIAGLIKIIQSMKHRMIPRHLHFQSLNPHISLKDIPAIIPKNSMPWDSPNTRISGLSSFGFSGTNAHIIISEYCVEKNLPVYPDTPQIIVLSAKNKDRLTAYAKKLAKYLKHTTSSPYTLSQISYTLQVGRAPMEERLAIVARDIGELIDKLEQYYHGNKNICKVFTGNTKNEHNSIDLLLAGKAGNKYIQTVMIEKDIDKLARLWTLGIDINWSLLYPNGIPNRMILPTYPFEKKRHWIPTITSLTKNRLSQGRINSQPLTSEDRPSNIKTRVILYPEKIAAVSESIETFYTNDHVIKIRLGTDTKEISSNHYEIDTTSPLSLNQVIKSIRSIHTIFHLGGIQLMDNSEEYIDCLSKTRQEGLLSLFRLVKSLFHKDNRDQQSIEIKILLSDLDLNSDVPLSGDMLGFAKTMANEYPELTVQCFHLSLSELQKQLTHPASLKVLLKPIVINELAENNDIIITENQLYTKTLEPLHLSPVPEPQFRHEGVYLIVGGAGKLGFLLSMYLARSFHANLIWVGRRKLNEDIQTKMDQIQIQGGNVLYLQTDATDLKSMHNVIEKATSRFGHIHAVFHSAVSGNTQLINDVTEDIFIEAQAPKIIGTMILHKVFQGKPLDFMVFFSSCQSFIGDRGLGHYASACSFQDGFARYMNYRENYPVISINWGFWGSTNLASSQDQNTLIETLGYKTIHTDEAWDILNRVIAYQTPQILALKAEDHLLKRIGVDLNAFIECAPISAFFRLSEISPGIKQPDISPETQKYLSEAFQKLKLAGRYLLLNAFQKMNVFLKANERYDQNILKKDIGLVPQYDRLFEAFLTILMDAGFIQKDGNTIITQESIDDLKNISNNSNKICHEIRSNYSKIKAYINLIEHCAPHYLEILADEIPAVEIMFPESSEKMVLGIYQQNPISDYYNQYVANALLEYVQAQVKKIKGNQKIQILEIGAGTGSTGAFIVDAIKAFQENIHYVYTDVSPKFIRFGESQYKDRHPFMRFSTLNIENDCIDQGYQSGQFDVIIATNVMHATRNIKNTLTNAKQLLKTNGWLILNELTALPEYLTLTFGLLKGWWLYEDESIRMDGGPLLTLNQWKKTLEEAGYYNTISFDSQGLDNQIFSQNVIIAESNGELKPLMHQSGNQRVRLSEQLFRLRLDPISIPSAETHVSNKAKKQTPEDEKQKYITEMVYTILADVLHIDMKEFEPFTAFADLGVGSILAVEIINTLNDRLNICLRITDLYNYPDIQNLVYHINHSFCDTIQFPDSWSNKKINHKTCSEIPSSDHKTIQTASQHEIIGPEIAVIGISGRFPGANNTDQLWENLCIGNNSITKIPENRWDSTGLSCKYGGFLTDIDCFDPLFFGISPKEAEMIDPQQRLFLQEAWHALEDAGYSPEQLDGKKCGVFAGVNFSDYQTDQFLPDIRFFTGNASSVLAARISYFLNLKGPGIAVNTACSASLVSVHLACESIRSGTSDIALAGGVQIMTTPKVYILAGAGGMLSKSGQCSTFDNRADGFVPAEGVGVVILKPLSQALEDRDYIYGVIKGSGINQDGKTNGITAPSAPSQTELIVDTYKKIQINPETISYVEAHGTGTELGDPIEIQALTDAFHQYTRRNQFCAIGSLKTNIGHSQAAAGIASLIKVLLCLKHGKLVPSLNFNEENRHIHFRKTPFYVNTQLKDWTSPPEMPKRAVVSSFGFSGTNAHIVIDEPPESDDNACSCQRPQVIVLSAKNDERLTVSAKNLRSYISNHPAPSLRLEDIAYTLQTGRKIMESRLAAVVSDIDALKSALTHYIDKKAGSPLVYTGNIKTDQSTLNAKLKNTSNEDMDHLIKNGQYEDLAHAWVSGASVNWNLLHSKTKPKRIPLPGYPFSMDQYWLPKNSCKQMEKWNQQTEGWESSKIDSVICAIPQGDQLTTVDTNDLRLLIYEDLKSIIALILKVDQDQIYLDDNINEYGFDSITLTEFASIINKKYELRDTPARITPATFFEHPSIESFADSLIENNRNHLSQYFKKDIKPISSVSGADEPTPHKTVLSERRYQTKNTKDIAVIGISGVMPQSENLDIFWQHLENEDDLMTEIPAERWDWRTYYGDPQRQENKTDVKWGGFVNDMDKFDAAFFGISPSEAELMDPQHRVFLEVCWKCIEDAGIKASDFSNTKVGVFAGVTTTDYNDLLQKENIPIEAYMVTGVNQSMLANRISYLLNLNGPSETINTACSSSLVAIHLAIEAIRNGQCSAAIAGGVSALFNPFHYIALSKAGMLSNDGRCKSFDKDANGYARGEGAGAVLLKPFDRALNDGDSIYAVIKGSAVNHGGRSNSLTAPNPKAQAELYLSAYHDAGIDPSTLSYIETHGTGTAIGDPIEINGLKDAFEQLYHKRDKSLSQTPHCGIGSVKTNIGHLEAAAGIAGFFKIVLSMKNQKLPANLHFNTLNPYIDLENTPFFIVNRTRPWVQQKDDQGNLKPLRAGLSSFGAGGTNVHMILESYQSVEPSIALRSDTSHLIILSAKNENRLQVYAQTLSDYLKKMSEFSIDQIAYTLQTGRESMPSRMAFVISNKNELIERLDQFCKNTKKNDNIYVGTVKKGDNVKFLPEGGQEEKMMMRFLEERNLEALAKIWTSRETEIQWHLLHKDRPVKRISLPTYPFARKRYWLPKSEKERVQSPPLHPLIQHTISSLDGNKYGITFTGDEFFLSDHRLEGKKLLPGVAYIEMARAAGELAGIGNIKEIKNIVWAQPLMPDNTPEAEIRLIPYQNHVDYEISAFTKDSQSLLCSQGKLFYQDKMFDAPLKKEMLLDIEAIKNRCHRVTHRKEFYNLCNNLGFQYGPGFQSISQLISNETEALATIKLPEHLQESSHLFVLHPALMDAAFQTVIMLTLNEGTDLNKQYLPFALGKVDIMKSIPETCYAYAVLSDIGKGGVRTYTTSLADVSGETVVRMDHFSLRSFQAKQTNETIEQFPSIQNDDNKLIEIFTKLSKKELSVNDVDRIINEENDKYG